MNEAGGTTTTERLRLEPIGPEHADALWRLHRDPGVAEYWGVWSRDDAQRYARDSAAAWQRDGIHKWIAYDWQTGDVVGRGGLSRAVVDGAEWLEVGWTVRSDLWGRGYATEIGAAGLTVAFDELGASEVVAFTEVGNARSRAVMERLGMMDPRPITHLGEPFVLYSLTRRHWPATRRLRQSRPEP